MKIIKAVFVHAATSAAASFLADRFIVFDVSQKKQTNKQTNEAVY